MEKINIAFFGTSDRSIPILNSLKNSQFNLCLCITKGDSKVGKKQVLKPSGVKIWCMENGVNFVTIENMDIVGTGYIATALKDENIQIGLVADFKFIIPEEIFNILEYKIVNIHFSLLPKYRGASPIQFAILNQDKETGISYPLVTKKMDAGPIISQTKYKIVGNETSEDLNNKLFALAAEEIPNVLTNYIEGKLIPQEQDESKASYTRISTKSTLLTKDDAKISLKEAPDALYAKIRAFHPWPVAWTHLGEFPNIREDKNLNLKVKIHKARLENSKLVIEKLQVEGKNIMTWDEFKNGYCATTSN